MKKVLFLYTEMAGYFTSCLKAWADMGNEAVVVHWPVNAEAPFDFQEISGVQFISRETIQKDDLHRLLSEPSFDAIVCSGWIDKGYLNAIRSAKGDIPKIVVLDNQWKGNLKQLIFSRLASLVRKRFFTHAWVVGEPQRRFALQMGFAPESIQTGFYAADVSMFRRYFLDVLKPKRVYPRAFVYVGRYIEHKGIYDLWDAFIKAKALTDSDWKLICIGTGEEFENRQIHEDIIHLGFKQPAELLESICDTGVFVLPSHFEPWGVVVHEFAAAGYPMIISDKVGAASQFLEHGVNGFLFRSGLRPDLTDKMLKFMSLTDQELKAMSERSQALSTSNSPQIWAQTLVELV